MGTALAVYFASVLASRESDCARKKFVNASRYDANVYPVLLRVGTVLGRGARLGDDETHLASVSSSCLLRFRNVIDVGPAQGA